MSWLRHTASDNVRRYSNWKQQNVTAQFVRSVLGTRLKLLKKKGLCCLPLRKKRKTENVYSDKTAPGKNTRHWNVLPVCGTLQECSTRRSWKCTSYLRYVCLFVWLHIPVRDPLTGLSINSTLTSRSDADHMFWFCFKSNLKKDTSHAARERRCGIPGASNILNMSCRE
jgi:hypothetical protein